MYDIPFSEHWILDFCLTPHISIFLLIIIPLLLLIIITIVQIKKIKEKKLLAVGLAVSYASFALFYVIYFFVYIFGGFTICRMSTFYKAIDPAHTIHAQIKERIKNNDDIPQNLADLKKMDSKNYELMTKHAKASYIYDSQSYTYTFFVRPSKYRVAVFDSRNDFKIYNLNTPFPDKKTNIFGGKYPPDYPGPWDKLPR